MNYPSYIKSQTGYYENIVNEYYTTIAAAKTFDEYYAALSSICRRFRNDFTNQDVISFLVNECGFEDEEAVNQWYIDNAGPLQKSFLSADLKAGNKYTLVFYSEFGFPVSVQVTFDSMRICGYAQYDDAVLLYYRQKGKRKVVGRYFYGYKKLAIYEGWKELPEDFGFNTIRSNSEYTLKKSKYTSFDERYFSDALSVLGSPILQTS